MATATNEPEALTEQRLNALIEQISAYIEHFHGGSVEMTPLMARWSGKLGGACLGCPLLPSTLHGWVEGTIHQFFPDIRVGIGDLKFCTLNFNTPDSWHLDDRIEMPFLYTSSPSPQTNPRAEAHTKRPSR
jgi:Fe-S cluster biogenesis protein NfuA